MSWFTNYLRWNLVIVILVTLVLECLGQEEGVTTGSSQDVAVMVGHTRRHRHRHRHDDSSSEDNEGSNTTMVGMGQFASSDETSSTALLQRLASLEDDVRYLCMEDEEDVERRIRHLGIKCVCPRTEAPVCGSDNVTYFNRCFLQCHARHALLNYHRFRITLKYFGRCGHSID